MENIPTGIRSPGNLESRRAWDENITRKDAEILVNLNKHYASRKKICMKSEKEKRMGRKSNQKGC